MVPEVTSGLFIHVRMYTHTQTQFVVCFKTPDVLSKSTSCVGLHSEQQAGYPGYHKGRRCLCSSVNILELQVERPGVLVNCIYREPLEWS